MANQLLKYLANHELTSVPAEKICSFRDFFRWKINAGKVVRLGLRNFSLKQTKVTLVSWRFYAQCRQALKKQNFLKCLL